MAEYPRFPLFVDLTDRSILIVGAGRIAARRASVLSGFCGHIAIVAPEIHPLLNSGAFSIFRRPFEMSDLDGRDLVLACTDDANLNAAIAKACRRRGIPVNVSSDKGLCDFYFPGIATEGQVVIGVTAGGTDHRRAREVTEAIREMLDGIDEDT